jgi:hypothetical protein
MSMLHAVPKETLADSSGCYSLFAQVPWSLSLLAPSGQVVLDQTIPFKLAPDRSAPVRLAPDRLAPAKSAPERLASVRLAPVSGPPPTR